MTHIERKEWRWALAWSLGICGLVTLPYFYGALLSTPARQFGGFIIGLEDGNSYLAKMQLGRSGYWLFRLVYTPEPHQGALLFSYYLLLGKVAGLVDLSNMVIFHLSKFLTVPFALLAFYYFTAYFTRRIKIRRLAFLIFGLSGGLGWLWLALGGRAELGRMPVDLWVPDASFFLSALTYTHLPLSQGLALLVSVTGLEFLRSGKWRPGLVAAGCGLLLSLVHPYRLPIISLLLGLYSFWQFYAHPRRLVRAGLRLLLIVLPTVPYLSYVFFVFYTKPAFIAWREQSLVYSPAPSHYLLGFGLTLLLALPGFWAISSDADRAVHNFLRVWLVTVPLLLYAPVALQRRFLDGYQAPLAIFAAAGLVWLLEKTPLKRGTMTAVTIALLATMAITNVLLWGIAVTTTASRPDQLFTAAEEITAAQWLAQRTAGEVVLGLYETGNFLPTYADVRAFVGHGPETINSAGKEELANRFFEKDVADAWRIDLLRRFNVAFVYYGPKEQARGGFAPAEAPYLEKIYDVREVQIYRVVDP